MSSDPTIPNNLMQTQPMPVVEPDDTPDFDARLDELLAEPKVEEPSPAESILKMIQDFDGRRNKLTDAELDSLNELLGKLSPTDEKLKDIVNRLYSLIHSLEQSASPILEHAISILETLFANNPEAGFRLFVQRENDTLSSALIRRITVGFLRQVNENSAPLSAGVKDACATVIFDLLVTNWGTDTESLDVLLNAFNNPFFADLNFAGVHETDRINVALEETFLRLDSNASEQQNNLFVQILEKFYPLQFEKLIGTRRRMSEYLQTLKDPESSDKDKKLSLRITFDYIERKYITLNGNPDKFDAKFIQELLGIATELFVETDFASEEPILQQGFEGVLLRRILVIKEQLQTPDSLLQRNYTGLFLDRIDTKIADTFDMLGGRNTRSTGIENFYRAFINFPTVRHLVVLGPKLREKMVSNLIILVPANRFATRSLIALEDKLNNIDGASLSDKMDVEGVKTTELSSHKDLLEGSMYGEFIAFILDMSLEDAVDFAERIYSASKLEQILSLLFTLRPEVAEEVEANIVKRENEKLDSLKKPVVESVGILQHALGTNVESKTKERVDEKLKNQSSFEKGLVKVSAFGIGAKYKEKWLAKKTEEAALEVTENREADLKLGYSKSVDYLESIFVPTNEEQVDMLLTALVDTEFRNKFTTLLNLLLDCSTDKFPQQILVVFRVMAKSPKFLEVLPRPVLSHVCRAWRTGLTQYQTLIAGEEYSAASQKYQQANGGIVYNLSPIKKLSAKGRAENSLSSLFDKLNEPRNVILFELSTIWQNRDLLDQYLQNPEFVSAIREAITTILVRDQRPLTSYESTFLNLVFETISLAEIDIPASLRVEPVRLLIEDSMLKGTPESMEVLVNALQENESQPPRFVQSPVADYYAAAYFRVSQTNKVLRDKIAENKKKITVLNQASAKKGWFKSGFRRGLTQEEKALEASISESELVLLKQFNDIDTYFEEFSIRSGARRLVSTLEKDEATLDAEDKALSTESERLTVLSTKFDAVVLPDKAFLIGDAAEGPLKARIAEVSTYLADCKLFKEPIPPFLVERLDDEGIDNLKKVVSRLMDAYYYQIYLGADTIQDPIIKNIFRFINVLVNNLDRFEYTQLRDSVLQILKQKDAEYKGMFDTSIKGSELGRVYLVSENLNYIDLRYSQWTEAIANLNGLVVNGNVVDAQEVQKELIALDNALNLNTRGVNYLISWYLDKNKRDGKETISNLLINLYVLMFEFKHISSIVNVIQRLIEVISIGIKGKKLNLIEITDNAKAIVDAKSATMGKGKLINADLAARFNDTRTKILNAA